RRAQQLAVVFPGAKHAMFLRPGECRRVEHDRVERSLFLRQTPQPIEGIAGDEFDWLRRLAKKQRTFNAIVLDPPTFSRSKEHGVFRAGKDYGKLLSAA